MTLRRALPTLLVSSALAIGCNFFESNADGLWNDWNESGDGNMPGSIVELETIPKN